MQQRVKCGVVVLGCGVVGGAVAHRLAQADEPLSVPGGVELTLLGVMVRDLRKPRAISAALLSVDGSRLISHPDCHIVVEALGGVEPARTLILQALNRGAHVVTSNKEVIARHGPELFATAQACGVALLIEGTVGGGIPVMMVLKASLSANRLTEVTGIINGTTNYILSAMAQKGQEFEVALQEAQALGYAEANPQSDVEAFDAAYKIAILANCLTPQRIPVESILREGITGITCVDVRYAGELGYVIKLLGIARKTPGGLDVRVHPAMIPSRHPLASVNGVNNAIAIRGDLVGEVVLFGPGAGAGPTSSAVLGDVLNLAAQRETPHPLWSHWVPDDAASPDVRVLSAEARETAFYVRILAEDQPGVIGTVGVICGACDISIRMLVQKNQANGHAEIVLVTHRTREAGMQQALERLRQHERIHSIPSVIRVEDL